MGLVRSGPRYAKRHADKDKPADNRLGAQRDRDRVLYSSSFRRLAGITQVVEASEGHVFHNRLTHTLKVAQVARRLAEKFIRPWEEDERDDEPPAIDPDVVETAALVHDLGHPPFGHVAERRLHGLLRGKDPSEPIDGSDEPIDGSDEPDEQRRTFDPVNGFEGNAQSFRTVARLARTALQFPGLDLTRASLAASLKYPWVHEPAVPESKAFRKRGAYSSEADDLRFALGLAPEAPLPEYGDLEPNVEAQIMDWADDITYAVHDAEDFYRAGLVPLDRLKASRAERRDLAEWVWERWDGRWRGRPISSEDVFSALGIIEALFGTRQPYEGDLSQRIAIRSFVSGLVGRYVGETELGMAKDGRHVLAVPDEYRLEVDALKELTWRYVIQRPTLASQQEGQLKIVDDLFHIFIDAMEGKRNADLLPTRAREMHEDGDEDTPARRGRIATDVICSLTEQEAVRLHQRLTGLDTGSITDPVLLR